MRKSNETPDPRENQLRHILLRAAHTHERTIQDYMDFFFKSALRRDKIVCVK